MATTHDLLDTRKSQALSLCKNCLHTVNFQRVGFSSRNIDDEIEDVGIECPNCNEWHHSFYTDKWLRDNRPDSKAPRKDRREYLKRFKKAQKRLNKIYGEPQGDNQPVPRIERVP